jgi:serine/threonine-protein kinase
MTNELVGTCEWLVAELVRGFLLEPGQIDPVVAEFRRTNHYGDANALAEYLVQRGLLTPFQVEHILEGDARALVIGPYVLLDPVGSGSMGTVFRALGKADRQYYAVKVLPMRSAWNVRQARKQVRAFADLPSNPAIVPFVDVGTSGGKHYLVWPFVEGEPLEQLVQRQGKLHWRDASRIAMNLAEALQVCHQRGIIHGLLKPSNILVAADGSIRLLDFGIGALLAENTDESLLDTLSTANATAGMLDCASPESILDPALRSAAGDQYSLGCVLYFCVTGEYPFPEGNMVEKMMAHQSQPTPSIQSANPQAPADLQAVIARLMQKLSDARYPNMRDVQLDLAAIIDPAKKAGSRPPLALMDTPNKSGALAETPALRRSLLTQKEPHAVKPPPINQRPSSMLIVPPVPPPTPGSSVLRQAQVSVSPPLPQPVRNNVQVASKPAEKSRFLGRVWDKLAFWKPTRDAVQCSVLAPPVLPLGNTVTLPIFAHCEPAETVLAMGRTYFPGHRLVGTTSLRRDIARGARMTFHLALPGITLDTPVQKFVWRGQAMPLPFAVRVPTDCRPGEIVGLLTIGEENDVITSFEFPMQIGRKK